MLGIHHVGDAFDDIVPLQRVVVPYRRADGELWHHGIVSI